MADLTREYGWYRTGCERLGQMPLAEAEFAARWQELEDHAERLKAAEAEGSVAEMDAATRAEMQRRIQDDPFVKAVLVGMAEEQSAG
ncbi:MAG TPA: hypothetical protein VFA07_16305 [Chthonomonadaceae bacterium]|nr:hypothetical protein [Chthonomonadaceae bacterium]